MKKIIYIVVMMILATGAEAQFDRSQPKPGPFPEVNFGKSQTFELKNGLKVMVVENHKLPRVVMSMSMDNPLFTEGNKKGISDITGELIGNGTTKMSKEDFQEEIDFMGSNINFSSNGAYANTLSRYFGRTLQLMAEGFTDPVFSQDDFEKEINRTIDGLKAEEKSVSSNAARVENVLVYGANHPRGEFVTEEKLKSLKLDDVKSFYKDYVVPNNAYLIVLGDVKFNEVKKLVKKHFGNWKKSDIPVSKYDEPKNVSKTEINFVDMPNAVQSEVSILSATKLKMTDSDYFAALIANRIFGGDFSSYLNMNLREANGWTYGARSSISANKYTGKFKAGASVRNEVTDSAVVESMKELNRIRTTRVDSEMLATVKAGLIGVFVMNAEKPEFVASQSLLTQTQNLPADFYQNYIKNINAVTPEQVQAAAVKYFSYDNARILVVGKASEVLPGLEKLGYKINYFDRYGNPTEKPEQKTISEDVTVKTVIENYIAAIGGREKLNSVKNMTSVYEAEAQGTKLILSSINTADGKTKTTLTAMGMEIQKSVFDGEKGYTSQQGMKNEMTEDEIESQKYNAIPFPELAFFEKKDLKLIGIESIDGKDAFVIQDGKTKHFYDVNTSLKVGSSTEIEAQGQKFVQTFSFGEYKDFDGIKIPSEFSMSVGVDLNFKLTDLKFNRELTDSDFE